jgi:glutamate N-acetyltransferase/amino-acid N-acetyltransferase
MAVGLAQENNVTPVPGIRLAATYAGLRKTSSDDLLLIEIKAGSRVAISLTRNLFCAAPVVIAKQHIQSAAPRYLLINAGNANAGTGEQGRQDAVACCQVLARLTNISEKAVLPFSTGVIGQPLAVAKIEAALPELLPALSENAWPAAARAIMTTDTVPKVISRKIKTGNGEISITGIAKGAGMICPNMATMLAFIATDADIEQQDLQTLHNKLINTSFNCISVDGDTSTNDACVLMATAQSDKIQPGTGLWQQFEQAASEVYRFLAQAIIRDGEGASKFVTLQIVNGRTEADCEAVARAVAHSPLVKTALFASDANWGRILAAVGRAGVELNIGLVGLSINDTVVVKNGQRAGSYTEEAGAKAFARDEINIVIDLNSGPAEYTLWTTDLSHEYVRINAEYRT